MQVQFCWNSRVLDKAMSLMFFAWLKKNSLLKTKKKNALLAIHKTFMVVLVLDIVIKYAVLGESYHLKPQTW